MIAAYLIFRYEMGLTHAQARALTDAGYVVLGWVRS